MVFIWCLYGVYRGFICFFWIYGGLMWFLIRFYVFFFGGSNLGYGYVGLSDVVLYIIYIYGIVEWF
jgi:hypothetical protein